MFEIILYKNKAERNRVDKSTYIEKCAELKGTLRESTSILTPIITIQFGRKEVDVVESNSEWVIWNGNKVVITLEEVLSCNYVYIPMFKRYYFIDDIVSVRNGLWQISMSVDVLMSFKDDILKQECFVARNEFEFDYLLNDPLLPSRCYTEYDLIEPQYSNNMFINGPYKTGRTYCCCISAIGIGVTNE